MIIASVKPGRYLIIDNDRVVGEVERMYQPAPRGPAKYWSDGYKLRWKHGEEDLFCTLSDLNMAYPMDNYPGYMKVLQKGLHGKSNSKSKRNHCNSRAY